MKTLKLIRLISIIAALGIMAAYTIVYILHGEYQLFKTNTYTSVGHTDPHRLQQSESDLCA